MIQTRHRIPEDSAQLTTRSSSIRCRFRSRCVSSSRARPKRAACMRSAEYGLMHVKLYEDIARLGHIATTYAYPVKVNGRYVMDPSPTPKFDNPKMNDCAALQLFGAGREKRIYAVPPLYRGRRRWISRIIRSSAIVTMRPARCAARTIPISMRSSPTTRAAACSCVPTPISARRAVVSAIAARKRRACRRDPGESQRWIML